jgi:hypothetical protein
MSGWQPAERGCAHCGAAIEHAVAHYCGQCGFSVGSSTAGSNDNEGIDGIAPPTR